MSPQRIDWSSHAIRVASSGVGALVGGPIGGALGGWLGVVLGPSVAAVIQRGAELYGESAGVRLFDIGTDALLDQGGESPQLEEVYRETLRLSLEDIRPQISGAGFDDWFKHWDSFLGGGVSIELPGVNARDFADGKLEDSFRRMMGLLDALGSGNNNHPTLLPQCRNMEDALFAELNARLPRHLTAHFDSLITSPKYDQAWKQFRLFEGRLASLLWAGIAEDVSAIRRDMVTREVVEQAFENALKAGRIAPQELKDKDAEISRLTEQLQKLQQELAARSSEPAEARLSALLAAGDVDALVQLKTQQIAAREADEEKLPQDYFELGNFHDLRFDWRKALEAYREAWRRRKDRKFGFSYAHSAQRQNHFAEAVGVYQSLLESSPDPPERAPLLNNLANLYSDTQRMKEAEGSYGEALTIRRALAKSNPETYLPDVATTLNNLANLYSDTQRMKEAEGSYGEALTIRRALAKSNPETYLPDVAMTLNNLAVLYSDTQRMREAEGSYGEALSTYRALAKSNPEAYLPYVATTLNNLAVLYSDTQRMKEAEGSYGEALSTYRALAKSNPEAYLPYVATTLNNLANLYSGTQRMKEARECCHEADSILDPLWRANPEVHGDQMAKILFLRALLLASSGEPRSEVCALARRAHAIAYHPEIKQGTQALVDQFCANDPA